MNIISKKEAISLGLSRYFTGKACINGHVSERSVATGHCCECERTRASKRRIENPEKYREAVNKSAARNYEKNKAKRQEATRRWLERNADVLREKRKIFYAENAERLKAEARARRASDPEGWRKKWKEYRLANRDKINALQAALRQKDPDRYRSYAEKWTAKNADRYREYKKARRKTDVVFAFNSRARCLIRGALLRSGYTKSKKTEEILGCSLERFRLQIERQFLPGMGWHNMHLWHIDHIVPVSSAKTLSEAESLNKAGNLRPYWGVDNKAKGAKITHLI